MVIAVSPLLKLSMNLAEAVGGGGGRRVALLVQVDEVLHALHGFGGGEVREGAAARVNEAAPRLLPALGAAHAEAVHAVAGEGRAGVEEFLIGGGHADARRLEQGGTIVHVQNLGVPGHDVYLIAAARLPS
jgi:hypothetical protein